MFIDAVQTLLSIKLPLCLISETAKRYRPAIPFIRSFTVKLYYDIILISNSVIQNNIQTDCGTEMTTPTTLRT